MWFICESGESTASRYLLQLDDDLCIDPQLMKDIESVKTDYGADMINCRYVLVYSINPYLTNYLTFGVGAKHTSTEASIWAQCATPTDLMVEEIS